MGTSPRSTPKPRRSACPGCSAGRAGPGHRTGPDHRPGLPAGLEAGHDPVVDRHEPGRRPGCGRRHHRRGIRGDGLARRTPGRHRDQAGPNPPARPVTPDRLALFALSSSWSGGRHCPLAARGYSRDGKKVLPQIEYGLLTDPAGRPVAVRVFPGNTADPTAFTAIVQAVKDTFKLKDMVMVAGRGMITSARVQELRELGGLGWVTALRAPATAALAPDDGPLQMSLFDQANLAEITHPDYPGERLVACRKPALAPGRARRGLALLDATDTELAKVVAAVDAGRLADAGKIGIRVGKVIGRYKMAKHYTLDITETTFAAARDQDHIS